MARATRIALDLALATGKALRPQMAIAWQYAKVEVIPPMSQFFFHGPGGAAMEASVAKFADGIISSIQGRITDMDNEEKRKIQEKEAAIKAAIEKSKQEKEAKAAQMAQEASKKKAEADKKAEEKAKADAQEKEKKKAAEKKKA